MQQIPGSISPWRILVVDDLPIWADSVTGFAGYLSCQVRVASNLSTAVREMAVWRPHLIILDLHMPRDAWEPLPHLRQKYRSNQKTLAFCEQVTSDPYLHQVIVAVVSVEEQPEQQDQAFEAGAHYFFNKGSFTTQTLERLLERIERVQTGILPQLK